VPTADASTFLAYHLKYALVADSVVHCRSCLSDLSLLHAERKGGHAFGKDSGVVEIAEIQSRLTSSALDTLDAAYPLDAAPLVFGNRHSGVN